MTKVATFKDEVAAEFSKHAEQFCAEKNDFGGWNYSIDPLYSLKGNDMKTTYEFTSCDESWEILPDRLRGRGDFMKARGRVKDAELLFDAATEIECLRVIVSVNVCVSSLA